MGLISYIVGSDNRKHIRKLNAIADKVEALADRFKAMSDDELKSMTPEFKRRLKENYETLDDILPEAFAVVREAADRVLGMRHFHVQLMGGVCLHQGRISEMRTGEGKTLVATLPAYLNALTGKGVHIVTVNDYLAKRDAEWMGKVHRFLGLTEGVAVAGMSSEAKRAAYNCDITYATNNELGFDYLRDNMVIYKEDKVQRELAYAIIDEVDSILIDEARTPLIISGRGGKSSEMYITANRFAKTLKADDAVGEGEEGIVFADADVVARVELGAALADEDIARKHRLAVRTLHAEALRLAVAPVVGRARSLFMSKQTENDHCFVPPNCRVIAAAAAFPLQRDLVDLHLGEGLTMALLFALVLLRLILEDDDLFELVLRLYRSGDLCRSDFLARLDAVFVRQHEDLEVHAVADVRAELFDTDDVTLGNTVLFAAVLDDRVQNALPPLSGLAGLRAAPKRT